MADGLVKIKRMTGAEAKQIRLDLGWTLKKMGIAMGFNEAGAAQNWFSVEQEVRGISPTLTQSELLRALRDGYRPEGFE